MHLKMFSWSPILPVLSTIFFPNHWLLSHITIIKTMDSGESETNPITIAIINAWKDCCPSQELNLLFFNPFPYKTAF